MKGNTKNVILAFALILLFSSVSIADTSATLPSPAPLTNQDKALLDTALRFLTDVAMLNISSYNIQVILDGETRGPNFDKIIKFNFSSAESKVDALFIVRENSLFWCMISPVKGSPVFVKQPLSDALSTAKATLDRLQAYSAKEYIPTMRTMLNSVAKLSDSKTSTAEFTQEIIIKGSDVTITWTPFANNLTNQQNQLILEFNNDNLMFYADFLGTYAIGSSDVKISEADATRIAIELARNYPLEFGNETVTANVLDKPFFTQLSLQNRGNSTLYPLWEIKLALDKMYPGGVTSFQVFIWADTGEVSSIKPIGVGAMPNETLTESPLDAQETSDYNLAIVIAFVSVATMVLGGYLFFRRNRAK